MFNMTIQIKAFLDYCTNRKALSNKTVKAYSISSVNSPKVDMIRRLFALMLLIYITALNPKQLNVKLQQ